jgi:L-ascorbate metabolism protein UlaG (beta-lactamase superfamily)
MDITYLGAGSVRLSGKNINVICDPYTDKAGLGKLSAKADVVTISTLDGFGQVQNAMVIDGPGEYETKGAMVTGVPARLHIVEDGYRATVYSIVVDGVNVVVTGNIAGKIDNKELGALGSVDVLVVPVGGHGLTLEPEEAAAVVSQLEPSYVVPVHYDDGKTTYPVPQASVSEFLKEMGSNPEPEAKLKVNAKEAPPETQVVVLKRVGE